MARDGDSRRSALGNTSIVLALVLVVCGMAGLSFASVPLYRLFCQVTGYGGTTQVATAAPETTSDRRITVRFNTDVSPKLAWRFEPPKHPVTLRVGEQGLAIFRAVNLSDRPMTGSATFNVTPLKAGLYFDKTQCFCFDEQRLEPGQTAEMGVSFFIDPAILEDRNLDDVTTVTLSYTFFRSLDDGRQAGAPEPAATARAPAVALKRPAVADHGV